MRSTATPIYAAQHYSKTLKDAAWGAFAPSQTLPITSKHKYRQISYYSVDEDNGGLGGLPSGIGL